MCVSYPDGAIPMRFSLEDGCGLIGSDFASFSFDGPPPYDVEGSGSSGSVPDLLEASESSTAESRGSPSMPPLEDVYSEGIASEDPTARPSLSFLNGVTVGDLQACIALLEGFRRDSLILEEPAEVLQD